MTPEPDTAKPPALDEAHLLHHSYDGIQEYDNPLPAWWIAIFYGSIVFAAIYLIGFQLAGWGRTLDEKYLAALAEYTDKRAARDAIELANVSEGLLAKGAADSAAIEQGRGIFSARCATCHAPDGRGLIGPNLTDSYQLHGSQRLDIYKTVRGGVAGTAMPAWGEQLSSDDITAVAEFAITLRGTNAPDGKPPQGQKVDAFR